MKTTFPKGALLEDPSGLFNASLQGNAWRAIDIHEGDEVDETAMKDLIRAAVGLNRKSPTHVVVKTSRPEPRRASGKRVG